MASLNRLKAGLPSLLSSKSLFEALDSPEQLQEIFAGFKAIRDVEENEKNGSIGDRDGDGSSVLEGLETKLLLSAQLGLALLEKQQLLETDNKAFEIKRRELEASVSQLLDRLASAYKENAQLIKVRSGTSIASRSN